MTIQQLRYIVAINRFRNFARAAESCDISQPTLSAMLVKLEEELDVKIFERTNKSVIPTAAGEKIIRQAEKALMETTRIAEIIPEMHLPYLTPKQRENLRKIDGDYLSQRRISLYIKEDYIRQRMLNTIIDTLKVFMPKGMLADGIVKHGIKL